MTSNELKTSLYLTVNSIETQHISSEIELLGSHQELTNKQMRKLTPFLDNVNLLRVGGRLSQSELPYDQKHPLLLPSRNRIVNLMLKQEHVHLGHAGPHTTLSNFRLRFWPLCGLEEVK